MLEGSDQEDPPPLSAIPEILLGGGGGGGRGAKSSSKLHGTAIFRANGEYIFRVSQLNHLPECFI